MRLLRAGWLLIVHLLLVVIWALALVRLLVDPTPRISLLFNWTPSLPYTIAWLSAVPAEFERGDLVLFSFSGEAQTKYPGLAKQPFMKVVKGVPGDEVTVRDRDVFVNGEYVGQAKTHAFDGRPLEPIAEVVIPPDHLYVHGTALDSFDSRYQASGLVHVGQILGRVTPLF